MQNSFRPVALRLSLSDVAALAAATARALMVRWRRDRPLSFGFHLRLKPAEPSARIGWTEAREAPKAECGEASA